MSEKPFFTKKYIARTITPVIEAARQRDYLLYLDPTWSGSAHVEITLTVDEIRRLAMLYRSAIQNQRRKR